MARFRFQFRRWVLWAGVIVARAAVAAPDYQDISRWEEVAVPPDRPATRESTVTRTLWDYASDFSPDEWRVFAGAGGPRAKLDPERGTEGTPRPFFGLPPHAFRGIETYAAVDDGWLIGEDRGEFGADLWWFSKDGKQSYRISGARIVAFFTRADGLYALYDRPGLFAGKSSGGGVMRFAREKGRWQGQEVMKLPFRPCAISVCRDGRMLITLSRALVAVGSDLKMQTLLEDAPWDMLGPGSSVLPADESKLYIGMRQYVGEFNLETKKLRLLIPSDLFLNKLSKEEDASIRKQFDH